MAALINGRYDLIRKLGQGGMGAIYVARDVRERRLAVIKVLRGRYRGDRSGEERFAQEARLSLTLRHPNLVEITEVSSHPRLGAFMAMEYLDGVNLAELPADLRPMPVALALDVGLQALSALAHLHSKGVVHRDISPENIMLVYRVGGPAVVKLIDLGVAKEVDSEGLTRTGAFLGKVRYAAPEQLGTLQHGETLDGRADLYALGCVLYQALTGASPFEAQGSEGFILAHVHQAPRSFDETDPRGQVPASLRAAVMKALLKPRDLRWQSAEDFSHALELCRGELDQRATRVRPDWSFLASRAGRITYAAPADPSLSPGPLPSRPAFPVRLLALAGSAALVAALAVVLVVVRRESGSMPPIKVTRARSPSPPTGSVLLNTSPWAHIEAVRPLSGGSSVAAPAVTPARLVLPPGDYRLTLRDEKGHRLETDVTVVAGSELPKHLEMPGFDVEDAIGAILR